METTLYASNQIVWPCFEFQTFMCSVLLMGVYVLTSSTVPHPGDRTVSMTIKCYEKATPTVMYSRGNIKLVETAKRLTKFQEGLKIRLLREMKRIDGMDSNYNRHSLVVSLNFAHEIISLTMR